MAMCSRSERLDASSAHFSAAFRDMFGMIPSELLKALQPVRRRNHEGMDGLAPSLSGNADHGALRHRRMLRDDVLHFHGIDVLATDAGLECDARQRRAVNMVNF